MYRDPLLVLLAFGSLAYPAWAQNPKVPAKPVQSPSVTGKPAASKTPPAAQNRDPNLVVELKVRPSSLVLSGSRDSRRVLVFGRLAGGGEIDLTRSAKFIALDDKIQIDADGFLAPVKAGEARVKIEEQGLQVELPVSIQGFEQPHDITFVRDVMPIINKVGCTSGPCHGAAKGKNGFKLSLRGYDPRFDYQMFVHDVSGRRINRVDPARSLALAKPTMQVAHGGGLRFELDSRYYQTLLQWISQGTPYGDPAASQIKKLEVSPSEVLMPKPGLAQQMQVIAHYADGTTRDVTRETSYTSNTPTVAEVTEEGHLKTLRKGEAALLMRYEGRFVPVTVTVLAGRPGFQWTQLPQHNYIDRHVDAKLQKLEILPSEMASDAEFLRRVSLDLVGIPPAPEEVRAFLADPAERRLKRSRWIDKLIARSEFADHWTVKWGDLFQNTRKFVGDKGVWEYQDWIRRSIAENKPYDQWVRELLTAQGSTFENPAANFFRITKQPKVAMETTTQVFLGIRMVCAQCHDHPFEQWTQNQYYQMAAFFSAIGVKEGLDSQEEIVYLKRDEKERQIKHPKDGRVVAAKYLFGESKGISQTEDQRQDLVRWLTSKDNPYFAKAVANRVWSYFFGRGIIEPVDDIRAGNPPSNEPLLAALTKDLTDHNFDLQNLIRTIVNSRTYQLSYRTNKWNQDDEANFSHALPRRLPAESLFDAISVATGSTLKFKDVPQNFKAQQFPDSTVGMGGFLDLFGRPQRDSACECERRSDVSLSQALNLINGSTVANAIADPEGRIAKWVIGKVPDKVLVEELYLATLGRPPQPKESELGLGYLNQSPNRAEKAQDLMWALLNSNAFLFNR
jgi:hypothetical protein